MNCHFIKMSTPNCRQNVQFKFKFFCNKSTSNLMHWRWLVIINKVVFVLNHSRHWVSHTPPRQEHQSDPNLTQSEIHQRLKTTTVWKNHFYHKSFEHFHSGKTSQSKFLLVPTNWNKATIKERQLEKFSFTFCISPFPFPLYKNVISVHFCFTEFWTNKNEQEKQQDKI